MYTLHTQSHTQTRAHTHPLSSCHGVITHSHTHTHTHTLPHTRANMPTGGSPPVRPTPSAPPSPRAWPSSAWSKPSLPRWPSRGLPSQTQRLPRIAQRGHPPQQGRAGGKWRGCACGMRIRCGAQCERRAPDHITSSLPAYGMQPSCNRKFAGTSTITVTTTVLRMQVRREVARLFVGHDTRSRASEWPALSDDLTVRVV